MGNPFIEAILTSVSAGTGPEAHQPSGWRLGGERAARDRCSRGFGDLEMTPPGRQVAASEHFKAFNRRATPGFEIGGRVITPWFSESAKSGMSLDQRWNELRCETLRQSH